VVDLPGDVALQDAHDLSFGLALSGATRHVDLGRLVACHPGHNDAPEGVVGLSVTAAVKAVTGDFARGSLERCDAAELGPRGLAAQSLRVVARRDE
jgi:hypothetical protein